MHNRRRLAQTNLSPEKWWGDQVTVCEIQPKYLMSNQHNNLFNEQRLCWFFNQFDERLQFFDFSNIELSSKLIYT